MDPVDEIVLPQVSFTENIGGKYFTVSCEECGVVGTFPLKGTSYQKNQLIWEKGGEHMGIHRDRLSPEDRKRYERQVETHIAENMRISQEKGFAVKYQSFSPEEDDAMRKEMAEALASAPCVLDESNDMEAVAVRANRDFDALENRRQALHEAVEVSHRRPTMYDTEHIFVLAEEFLEWLNR